MSTNVKANIIINLKNLIFQPYSLISNADNCQDNSFANYFLATQRVKLIMLPLNNISIKDIAKKPM